MNLKRWPGFIDVHVHLREPGATQKEDFHTGSRAAVKGGVTFIIDMPNNPEPTISIERLEQKVELSKKAICDVGFHYGTNGHNTDTFTEAASRPYVYGLKLYCNHTTGEMLIDDQELLEDVFRMWPPVKPILVHAEGEQLALTIGLAKQFNQKLHVCHITQASEVQMVREAKAEGFPVTAGVCPHHLYLTGEDRELMKGYAIMKPPLGTKEDQNALWKGLADGTVDIIETDHAPHTREEKEKDPPAFGIPGLETSVPLMWKAVVDGKISETRMIQAMHDVPKRIFNIPDQPGTYVEFDADHAWQVGDDGYETKCGWSSFAGWDLPGKVLNVTLRGKQLMQNGRIL